MVQGETSPETNRARSKSCLARGSFARFVAWLEDVRLQLLLPVRLVRIRRTHMELAICGFGDCVKAFVCRSGRKGSYASMTVRVQWNGEDVDGLLELDVYTHRTKDGYVCTQCPSDSAETYPTIEAAWTAHVFEVFLEFVNENLSTAACLAIHFRHGSSWASLTAADINHGKAALPLSLDDSMQANRFEASKSRRVQSLTAIRALHAPVAWLGLVE